MHDKQNNNSCDNNYMYYRICYDSNVAYEHIPISITQILSLMITLASCLVMVSLLTHLFDLPKNPILEFDGVIQIRDGVSKTVLHQGCHG